MKHFILYIIFFSFSVCHAQMLYPIVGIYKGKSAQGMAIWGDEAYLFNDGGSCRVFNLKTGEVTKVFSLASAGKKNHVNAACFGKEKANGGSCPVIYISEYNLPSRCFVECINDTVSTLVQTIQAQNKGKAVFVQSWIVDKEGKWIYAIARQTPPKGDKNSAKVKISKYRLPDLSEGVNINLSEKDCIDSFIVDFASGTQGGKIIGKYLYIVTGLQETSRGQFNAARAIQVIDLKKRKLVKTIDLTYITTNEPEDIDFYRNKMILYTGQNGGLYLVK
ncbi:MAG: hypothetical protein J1F40_02190 [Prevotellaceae bacterium]|nr:hypothetical protein [Prevotellaceae bacterium]